jgi:hypothetical protein
VPLKPNRREELGDGNIIKFESQTSLLVNDPLRRVGFYFCCVRARVLFLGHEFGHSTKAGLGPGQDPGEIHFRISNDLIFNGRFSQICSLFIIHDQPRRPYSNSP